MSSNSDDDKTVNRRRFFRQGLRELLRPVVSAVEPLEEAARHFARLDAATDAKSQSAQLRRVDAGRLLRPPGALAEQDFLNTCSRCGLCANACPADCIRIDSSAAIAGGAPFIDANVMPCVVCDGLQCMYVCPTGALVPTAIADIDMGTAAWEESLCLRSQGQDCTICVDRCPIGTVAIELTDGKVHVHENGCVGCGVCQHDCPTSPKSIVVVHARDRT